MAMILNRVIVQPFLIQAVNLPSSNPFTSNALNPIAKTEAAIAAGGFLHC